MNILRFHWIRFIGAIVILFLALCYLFDYKVFAMTGFIIITVGVTLFCAMLRKGKVPAVCDLCGSKALMKVEYEPGFINVRLVVNCPHCGRVINTAKNGIKPGRESEQHSTKKPK